MKRIVFLIFACLLAVGCNNGSLLDTTECLTDENGFFKTHEGHTHDEEDEEASDPSSDPCDPELHFNEPS